MKTYNDLDRDDWPEMATIWIPFLDHFLMAPAFRYSDGNVSRWLGTNSKWAMLTEEQRKRLTVDPSWTIDPDER